MYSIIYMPSLSIDILKQLHDDYKSYPCFIETGTNNGNTTFAVEPFFNTIYTIEFSEQLYNKTKAKYNGNKITFLHGDSSIVFDSLLPTITQKSIFFLDGHYCGGNSGQSAKDCPLDEEITSIKNNFKYEGIIIVDDYRLFGLDSSSGKLSEDWSKISKDNLLNILGDRVDKVYHLDSEFAKNDRLIIHIRADT